MVIGNGLIAGQFNKYRDNDNVIIFASGVSNSKETNSKLFDFINIATKIVNYFFTFLIESDLKVHKCVY